MARGPVLGLALLATVSAGAAVADGKDGGVVLGPSMADVACSSPLTPNNSAMHFPMPIPVRALTFDATISSEAASTANFEPPRVEAELPSTGKAVALSPRQPFPDPGVIVETRYVIGSNDFKAVHGVEF